LISSKAHIGKIYYKNTLWNNIYIQF